MTYREQIGHPACQCAGCKNWDRMNIAAREHERLGQANALPPKEQAEYDHSTSVAAFGGHFADRGSGCPWGGFRW